MKSKIVGLAMAVFAAVLLLSVAYIATQPPIYAADASMQIVYAHFWNSASGEATQPSGYTPVTYVVVLNVTNYAPQVASIDPANIIVAERISQTSDHGWSFGNIIIFGNDNSQLVNVNSSSSKLVAITGFTDIADFTKPFDVYAHIIAQPPSELGKHDEHSTILDSSSFNITDNGYLYNALLSGGQKLLIDGVNAQVIDS